MKRIATVLPVCLFAFAALAQVTTGRLEGVVTDPQGAAVPGAQVKVTDKETGRIFETFADEKGLWAVPSVSTGTYTVSVNHPGFKTTTIENVKVDAGVPATVNAKLEVGSLAETVEVLNRSWHVEGQAVRPDHRMVAHTGFLTHARLLDA